MADIFSYESGEEITRGLQGCRVCDAALITARDIAARRNETVILVDDDGEWIVQPDGSVREYLEHPLL